MADIVERLRQYRGEQSETTECYNGLRDEAADEIDRLGALFNGISEHAARELNLGIMPTLLDGGSLGAERLATLVVAWDDAARDRALLLDALDDLGAQLPLPEPGGKYAAAVEKAQQAIDRVTLSKNRAREMAAERDTEQTSRVLVPASLSYDMASKIVDQLWRENIFDRKKAIAQLQSDYKTMLKALEIQSVLATKQNNETT